MKSNNVFTDKYGFKIALKNDSVCITQNLSEEIYPLKSISDCFIEDNVLDLFDSEDKKKYALLVRSKKRLIKGIVWLAVLTLFPIIINYLPLHFSGKLGDWIEYIWLVLAYLWLFSWLFFAIRIIWNSINIIRYRNVTEPIIKGFLTFVLVNDRKKIEFVWTDSTVKEIQNLLLKFKNEK